MPSCHYCHTNVPSEAEGMCRDCFFAFAAAEGEEHVCARDGCARLGVGVGGEYAAGPEIYLCRPHARAVGWCLGCNRNFAGVESFEFSSSGLCDDCDDELDDDDDELDDVDWDDGDERPSDEE